MSLVGEQILLRIYLQSADRPPHNPTYERIVQAARRDKLAGATVLRGILGAGYHGLLKESAWSITQNAPVIVEIVDTPEKIMAFVQGSLRQIMSGGMMTLERAFVAMYRGGPASQNQAGPMQLAAALRPLSAVPTISPENFMTTPTSGVLLRVFMGESDKFDGKPLYEAIVQKVRELGLAGATVLRGSEGFGAHSVIHKTGLLEMSADLPIVIEIVDGEEKIKLLLPQLEQMVKEGMITMEHVSILMYRSGGKVAS